MPKAAVLSGPNKIEVKEFPRPAQNGGMLLKVNSAGVCGTDVHIYKGHVPGLPYPIIQGHEVCGTIEELPDDSGIISNGELAVGDRVALVPGISCGRCNYCRTFPHMENYCQNRSVYGISMSCSKAPHLFGGFSETLCVLPRFSVFKIPKKISADIGVLIETLAVAMRAVERGIYPNPQYSMGFGIGANLVIQGAGPIGILAAISGKVVGTNVIVLDEIEHRIKMAKSFGLTAVNINGLKEEERIAKVKDLTEGMGADIVVECTGELQAVNEGVQMLRRGGRYVEMGHFADVGVARLKPYTMCRNDIELIGSVIAPPAQFKKALHVLENYDFPYENLISHRYVIDDAEDAINNAAERKGMKTVINP